VIGFAFMGVNVEVTKNNNENGTNLLRRFTKRVQESGVLRRVRSLRYRQREKTKLGKKRSALVVIGRRAEYERLKKLGKLPEKKKRSYR
jgi:ribosomal protein S21